MKLLENKVAVITGAARGIGKQIALLYAQEGCQIAFTDLVINEAAEQTKQEIEATGVRCMAYASNAADFDETHRVIEQIVKDFGHIDILVNNAGDYIYKEIGKYNENEVEHLFKINSQAPFMLSALYSKQMKENELYFGQILENDYIRTKFLAERAVLSAVKNDGLKAKIISVNESLKSLFPLDLDLTDEGVEKWLQWRIIPKNRTFVGEILAQLGLTIDDTKGIIDVCKGLSLNDSYWVVPLGFSGKYAGTRI